VCLVERNVVGWGKGLISVSTCILMCALWGGMWQNGVMASYSFILLVRFSKF
jgi:hypothetical protein